jgi:HlyD family secretion protein
MVPRTNPDTDIKQALGIEAFSSKKRTLKRFLYWGGAAIILFALLLFWSLRNGGSELIRYETQNAVSGDLTITVSATGNLEPTNQVDVSSELSGIIETVSVDDNDHVTVNQELARLDTDKLNADVKKYRAALEAARAQVLQAQATLRDSRAEFERLRHAHDLSGGKVPSAYTLESAEAKFSKAQADVASAQAQVMQAKAVLEYAETDLAKAVIRSPINGIVLSRDAEPGQTVAASLQAPILFTLAEDLSRMELRVDVDEADVGQVKAGQEATFTVDAYPDHVFPARITRVRYGAQNTDGVVTYEAVLEVNNKALLLRPGMTATADITVARVDDAVLVPNAALRFSPSVTDAEDTEKKETKTSVTSRLFPRPPRSARTSSNQSSIKTAGGEQQVWTLNGQTPTPIKVTTGLSDGIKTELTSGNIAPNTPLVIGVTHVKK